ncbi:MAG: AEC family transporter [Clostridia bacterium]|nr:AEC family transporter [Clostridia bacterium]
MTLFLSTLNQMGFLFLLIVIGYIVVRVGAVPDNATMTLSKMENNIFIPALVMGTFMTNLTPERIRSAWIYLVGGAAVLVITAPLAILIARSCSKDSFTRNIYTYGLAFSNFGFMGNAVVKALFPHIFMEYLIFVLPFWALIYTWGTPCLLIPVEGERKTWKDKLRAFINPMFIGMLVGIAIGLSGLKLPSFLANATTTLGDCMSPIAMLLTGMTIAKIDLKKAFTNVSVYVVSLIRLLAIPAVFLILVKLLPLNETLEYCMICNLAMPLGLSTIVVPAAYGKDSTVAASMALISHLLSCITIPIIFFFL